MHTSTGKRYSQMLFGDEKTTDSDELATTEGCNANSLSEKHEAEMPGYHSWLGRLMFKISK